MAIFTATELTEQLAAWKAALLAVANSQSYSISGRTLTKADLPEIRNTLQFLEKEQDRTSGRNGPYYTAGRVKR
jgi:hypothetical protein